LQKEGIDLPGEVCHRHGIGELGRGQLLRRRRLWIYRRGLGEYRALVFGEAWGNDRHLDLHRRRALFWRQGLQRRAGGE
jgi:hypothetical protein